MDDVPIIDYARLELITRGDTTLAKEFLNGLFDEAEQLLERLNGLITGSDRSAVADAAHTLKGMASELGAMRLRAAAAELEAEPVSKHWAEQVESVKAALGELRSADRKT